MANGKWMKTTRLHICHLPFSIFHRRYAARGTAFASATTTATPGAGAAAGAGVGCASAFTLTFSATVCAAGSANRSPLSGGGGPNCLDGRFGLLVELDIDMGSSLLE